MNSENIPLIREALRAQRHAAPLQTRGPAIISIIIIFFFSVLGFILDTNDQQKTHSLFLVFFILGGLVAGLIYFFSKKIFQSDSREALIQHALSQYDSLIGRMHGWGFQNAAQVVHDFLKLCIRIETHRPALFSVMDDILHGYIVAFSQIGQTKTLIGKESDLKLHCDKIVRALGKESTDVPRSNIMAVRVELAALELRIEKLEDIAKCAIALTERLKNSYYICADITQTSQKLEEKNLQSLIEERQLSIDSIRLEMSKIGL